MSLVVFAKNIDDERYIVSGNSNYGLGFHSAVYSKPREFGVKFKIEM
jgi:iron complex outermembrane receptor protein